MRRSLENRAAAPLKRDSSARRTWPAKRLRISLIPKELEEMEDSERSGSKRC